MMKRYVAGILAITTFAWFGAASAGPSGPSLQPLITQARAYLTTGAPLIMPPAAGRVFKPQSFTSNTAVTYQRVYVLTNNASQVRFVFQNWAQQGSPEENSPGAFTLKASVIWGYTGGNTGNFVPITFNGVQSVTLAAYQTLISDPIDVAPQVVAGSVFAVRSYVTTAGAYIPVDSNDNYSRPVGYNEGYLPGDYTATTNSYGGATVTSGFGPTLVTGYNPTGDAAGVFAAGDSICHGTGWTSGPNNGYPQGFFNYWAQVNGVGLYNACRSGETLATALTYGNAGFQYRSAAAHGFKYALVEYSTNDIGAGTSLATIEANLITFWGQLQRKGMKVYQTTVLPRTSSTDNWTTVINQSAYGGTGQETTRQNLNKWLRAPATAGAGNSAAYDAAGAGVTLTGVADMDALVEANSDNSLITINATTGAISNGSGGFWKVDLTIYATGTATTWADLQHMTDTGQTWTANQWWGYQLKVTSGAGTPAAAGQIQAIATNGATQITTNVFTTKPDAGAGYAIIKQPTADGIHPNTAVQITMSAALNKLLN